MFENEARDARLAVAAWFEVDANAVLLLSVGLGYNGTCIEGQWRHWPAIAGAAIVGGLGCIGTCFGWQWQRLSAVVDDVTASDGPRRDG